MNWQPMPDDEGLAIKDNQGFFVVYHRPLEQVTVVDSRTWVILNAAPTYLGQPGRIAIVLRETENGFERGRGTIEEALEIVKGMAAEPDVNVEELTKALRNIMDPLELMAFLADIPQRKCEPALEIANRSKKPSLFRAFASRFRKAR